MLAKDILIEIDHTLDSLIQNAKSLENLEISPSSHDKIRSVKKNQERLLAHLVDLDKKIEKKKVSFPKKAVNVNLQEKLLKLDELVNISFLEFLNSEISYIPKKRAKIRRNRRKGLAF